MPSEDLAQIRRELLQMKQELEPSETGIPALPKAHRPEGTRRSPLMDFGLFVLFFMFWLVIIVTVEAAAGIGVYPYTCWFAVPCAWLMLFWLRKGAAYTLLVAAAGVLFLAAAAYLASSVFDMEWDSNSYHKPLTGMLMYGWNPFRETMIEFANSHDYLPYNSGWLSYQVDNQPKASFMIGASLYAFTGGIAYGKIFNLASMAACIAIGAALLRDAFRLRRAAALLSMLLACANLITLSQIGLYYNDGFIYQMLTIAMAALAYCAFKPNGAHVFVAKAAAFTALCVAVNVKTSAVLYAAILCAAYVVARLITLHKTRGRRARGREIRRMALYFLAMAVCGSCVLGAATYVANFLRYGNPLYGMLGENSMNSLLPSLMSEDIHALPSFIQFFVSMFSHTANALFTEVNLKIPFTFTHDEWVLATHDANVGGWGILFGGIFLVSVVIILTTAFRMRRRSPGVFRLLLGVLATVILPVFVIPYLFSARYYLQPFWIPLAALVCLFAPSVKLKKTGKPKYPAFRILKFILTPVLCALLIANASTGMNYLAWQIDKTQENRETIRTLQEAAAQGNTTLDVTTISRGYFYGLMFNLRDEGLAYNFCETLRGYNGELLKYMIYDLRERGPEAGAEANDFLYSLYQNGYLVVITANAGASPTEMMTEMLNALGLMQNGAANPDVGYLAVINTEGQVVFEQAGYAEYQEAVDGTDVQARCTGTVLTVEIGGTEIVRGGTGLNVVVYDTVNLLPVASVSINPGSSPVMTVHPVRIGMQ